MHILNIGKRRRILKNRMLLQATEKIDTIVFTCAILRRAD
jgi:hypothetical protein